MKIIKLLILLSIVVGGYNYWQHHLARPKTLATQSTNTQVEFITLPVQGLRDQTVFVVAAKNCPREESQRANRLTEDLMHKGIPVERIDQVFFSQTDIAENQTDIAKYDHIMSGPLPIVFINGRAKANPSFEEVVSEFQKGVQ